MTAFSRAWEDGWCLACGDVVWDFDEWEITFAPVYFTFPDAYVLFSLHPSLALSKSRPRACRRLPFTLDLVESAIALADEDGLQPTRHIKSEDDAFTDCPTHIWPSRVTLSTLSRLLWRRSTLISRFLLRQLPGDLSISRYPARSVLVFILRWPPLRRDMPNLIYCIHPWHSDRQRLSLVVGWEADRIGALSLGRVYEPVREVNRICRYSTRTKVCAKVSFYRKTQQLPKYINW